MKVYRYKGEYGTLEVDLKKKKVLRDELNRERIWKDAGLKCINQQNIYAGIIGELFGEDASKLFPPRYKNVHWNGSPTNLGFKAINDEIEFVVDQEGTFIYDKEGWVLSYAPEYY